MRHKLCSFLIEKGFSFTNDGSNARESKKSLIDPEWKKAVVIKTNDQELFLIGLVPENI